MSIDFVLMSEVEFVFLDSFVFENRVQLVKVSAFQDSGTEKQSDDFFIHSPQGSCRRFDIPMTQVN